MDALLGDEKLRKVVGLPLEAARPRRIILIGSHARGEQKSDSDLDLLVIEEEVEDHSLERVRLRRALSSIRMPIDLLVYSEKDVRTRGHWLGTPLHEALQEGKELYAAG